MFHPAGKRKEARLVIYGLLRLCFKFSACVINWKEKLFQLSSFPHPLAFSESSLTCREPSLQFVDRYTSLGESFVFLVTVTSSWPTWHFAFSSFQDFFYQRIFRSFITKFHLKDIRIMVKRWKLGFSLEFRINVCTVLFCMCQGKVKM